MNQHVKNLSDELQQKFFSLDNDILHSFTVPSYALKEGVRGQAPQRGSYGNGQAISGVIGTPLTQIVNKLKPVTYKKLCDDVERDTTIEGYTDDVALMSEAVKPLEVVSPSDDIDLVEYVNVNSQQKTINELAFVNMLVASYDGKIGNLEKDSHNLAEFKQGFEALL